MVVALAGEKNRHTGSLPPPTSLHFRDTYIERQTGIFSSTFALNFLFFLITIEAE